MSIYYFSGTGNSFYIAKEISKRLNESNLFSISDLLRKPDFELFDKELIIICPLYFYSVPPIVLKFIDRLDSYKISYISFVFTAAFPNGIAINKIKNYCLNKNISVNSCFYVKMPNNYVIKYEIPTPMEIDKMISKADKKINRIIEIFKNKLIHFDKEYRIYSLMMDAERKQKVFQETISGFDSKFRCSDDCNGCRICEKNCPVDNILVEDKPVWTGHCAGCLKCINICSAKAIRYDGARDGERYFNPRVKLVEFK